MKKYILFDHDGVLVDTEQWFYTSNKRALAELGIELDHVEYLKNMTKGISCWDLVKSHGFDQQTIDAVRVKRNRYYQEYLTTENIEISGVESVLRELSKDYTMAIITTSKRTDFELIHKERNMVQHMDVVLAREDYTHSKPDPEPYLLGLEKLGALKEDTLIVEDSERGLMSAVAAGVDCVVVHNEFTKTHDFSKATHRINTLNELPSLLATLQHS